MTRLLLKLRHRTVQFVMLSKPEMKSWGKEWD